MKLKEMVTKVDSIILPLDGKASPHTLMLFAINIPDRYREMLLEQDIIVTKQQTYFVKFKSLKDDGFLELEFFDHKIGYLLCMHTNKFDKPSEYGEIPIDKSTHSMPEDVTKLLNRLYI